MADIAAVTGLLMERCEAMATTGPMLPVAHPDTPFDPPADGKYLRIDLFTNATRWEGLSSGRIDQGLLQIMVVWPAGTGPVDIRRTASAVQGHFPKGLTLFGPGTRIRFNREPWVASALEEEHLTMLPITVSWVAT